MIGKIMAVTPVIVISVLLLSLVESLLILPAHLSSAGKGLLSRAIERIFGKPIEWHDRTAQWVDRRLRQFIDKRYVPTLKRSLANPLVAVALGIALMLFTAGWIAGGHIKFVFMPKIESYWLTVSVVMPQGTTVAQTAAVVRHIETAAFRVRDEYDAQQEEDQPSIFRNVFTSIGDQPMGRRAHFAATGPTGVRAHLAEVNVELLPSEERDISSAELEARVRQKVGELPGPESLVFSSALFSTGNAIEVELASDDFAQLLEAVERLKEEIASYPGTGDIEDSFQEGKLEMKLSLKSRARTLGITMADLARQVRYGFYGGQALRLQRGSDDVRIMVRYPEEERRGLGDVESMRIRTPAGGEVPFPDVATVELGHGYASIQRVDGQRVVTVSASVDEEQANADEINRDLAARFLPALMQDYPGLHYRYAGEQRERADSMQSLASNFIIALFAIYMLLAVPFRSYTQPVVIMSAIPFGIIGAVWGHVIMGLDLTMLSIFGIVALSGVVVNDSLVLLSFYNQLRAQGVAPDEALIEAGRQRFRPILLTSLTTFFGLLPMILEKSMQAKFLIPMAVSLGFGILFSTGIILIGVPTGMKMLARLQELLGGAESEEEQEAEATKTFCSLLCFVNRFLII